MIHPFMPFVSEEIYGILPGKYESINEESWPQPFDVDMSESENEIGQLITMIQAVREIKTQYHLKPSTPVDVMICDTRGELISRNEEIAAILERMCKANWLNERIEGETVSRTILKGTLEILLADVVNVEEEIAKCEKELERLTKEIQRCEGMLNNQNFISKAPQAKINAEKDKLTNYREQYDLTQATLVKLKG